MDAEVDTSIAGFIRDLPRNEVVDFTPGIFKSIRTIVIRRPSRHDFSLRYFTLEFTLASWFLILSGYLAIMCFFLITLYVLFRFKLEENKSTTSQFTEACYKMLDVCLKAFLNKVIIVEPRFKKQLSWA